MFHTCFIHVSIINTVLILSDKNMLKLLKQYLIKQKSRKILLSILNNNPKNIIICSYIKNCESNIINTISGLGNVQFYYIDKPILNYHDNITRVYIKYNQPFQNEINKADIVLIQSGISVFKIIKSNYGKVGVLINV